MPEINTFDVLIRVSTEEQKKKGWSPDTQRHRTQRYIDEHNGQLHKMYDMAVGKTAKIKDEKVLFDFDDEFFIPKFPINNTNRPDLREYLNDLERGEVAPILLITKWDRFSRNLPFQELFLLFLKSRGIQVIAIDDTNEKLPRRILTVVNENELDVMASRVNVIHENFIEEGKITYRPPFGYDRVKDPNDDTKKITVVDESKAQIVKKIFELASNGVLYTKVAEMYNMNANTVKNILTNPFYIGKVKYKNKVYNGEHKPIISKELFYSIQNRIK